MYWGNPHTYYAKLNDDMISLKGDIVKLDYHLDNYQEGPWFYKRNGQYYLAYATTCCPEALGYAMSDSPTGPWEWKGYIMKPTERDRGNHPGICDFKGHSYIFGQNYDLILARSATYQTTSVAQSLPARGSRDDVLGLWTEKCQDGHRQYGGYCRYARFNR